MFRGRDRESDWRSAQYAAEIFGRSIVQADQKGGALVLLIAALVGGVVALQGQLNASLHPTLNLREWPRTVAVVLLVDLGVCLARCVRALVDVLFPRLTSSGHNLFFFGDAARYSAAEYGNRLRTHPDLARELAEESRDLAEIASLKFGAFGKAVRWYSASFVAFAAWACIATLALPFPPKP
jgi:Family of unknown function (DUF5706)